MESIGGCYDNFRKDNEPTQAVWLEPFAGIYWIAVAFIYLIPGFLLGYWNKTWIIWPIAGVIYGIIYKLYEIHLKRRFDK